MESKRATRPVHFFLIESSAPFPHLASPLPALDTAPTEARTSRDMYHPTYTPTNVMPRDEKGRSKSPPRVPKPSSLASSSRPVPLSARPAAAATKPGSNGDRPLAYSLEKSDAANRGEEGLGGEPFETYAGDLRELVAALREVLKEVEEDEGGEGEEGEESASEKLSEAVRVAKAFFRAQIRVCGEAEKRSLAELKSAVQPLILLEERKEERRRRRDAGAEEDGEEEETGGEKKVPGRLSAEIAKSASRGLDATMAVLLVEEEAAREKGLLH